MMEPRSETQVRMPDLVFDLVSKYLSPKILRPCRLVCKSWNNIACEILQKIPVSFCEGSYEVQPLLFNQRLSEFSDLLASRKEEISHPFRKISIKETSSRENFWKLIIRLTQYEDIEVSNLEFVQWTDDEESIDLKREIMTCSQSTLRTFSLSVERLFLVHLFEWKLVNLEKLEINCRNFPTDSVKELLENILVGPKLSKLSLTIEVGDVEKLLEILSIQKIRRVFSLEFKHVWCDLLMVEQSKGFRYFTKNPFKNVKSLDVLGELRFTLQLVGIFAQALQVLNYTQSNRSSESLLALDLFPTCPQLRELNLIETNTCVIENSFSKKFPSLKKFSCHFGLKTLGELRPHFGVEQIDFSVRSTYTDSEHNSEICTFCKVGQYVLRHFPRFDWNHHIFRAENNLCATVETLWSMVNYFPNGKALKIHDCGELIQFVSEIGTTLFKDDVLDAQFVKVTLELFPLQNFRKLNSLELTWSGISFTPAIIRLGLGKIPTLKHLRFEDRNRPGELRNDTMEAFQACRYIIREKDKEAFTAKLFPLSCQKIL